MTNQAFRKFLNATGYVTFAEIPPDPKDYPGAQPHMLKAGSLGFDPPNPGRHAGLEPMVDVKFGANWRRPYGPRSSITGLDDHPVVHVTHGDAETYARWVGKDLPTEAEFEFAARGGLDEAEFAWGDEMTPDIRHMANTWQGRFPFENLTLDGYKRTSPVTAFPPNGYGVYDMIGNVWSGPAIGILPNIRPTRKRHAASPKIRAADGRMRATAPASRRSRFRARCSRAVRIYARRTTTAATDRPRGIRSQSIRPRATSDFDASYERRNRHRD